MKPGLQTLVDNVARFTAGIEKLASTRVLVGVPAEKGSRKDGEPINNAALAYIMEQGAPEAGIPARPFLKPGIESKQDDIAAALVKTGRAALDGKPEAVDRGYNITGLIGQNAVRAKINEGAPPPLKPATLAARRARGRTGDKPLIDTGQLRNSLTYVIRKV
jgi:phage gpG-like protein